MDSVAEFWSELLSGDAGRARQAFAPLSSDEQQAVLLHLRRMTTEPGWHPAQVENALAALDALLQRAG
jgi:hypothetical protein